MNTILILIIFGIQATLFLASTIALKSKLDGLEEQIKGNNVHIDGQANKVAAEIEKRGQFNEKAIGTLSQNIAACGYEIEAVKDTLENVNKTIKQEMAKNLYLHLTDKF